MDSQAAALIVHDIKNALAVLEGELQALSREPERERATRAWRNCGALRDKLIGFLTLYKASNGGLHARVEDVAPADFLKGLLADTPHARDGVRIELDAEGMPALAFFDEHLVGLALDAALQNAMRFAVSRVTIACRAADAQGVMFSVRDDGSGLGKGVAAGDHSTGLGTELCRTVAAAHRRGQRAGLCRLYDAPGGGAVFELYLP
jgi:signal transduction histidine kinase